MDESMEGHYTSLPSFVLARMSAFPWFQPFPPFMSRVTSNRLRTGVGRFGSDMCWCGDWERQPLAYEGRINKQNTILFYTARPSDH